MALNYLEGLIIATDSLRKTGMKINLFVYDTENDSSKVQDIIDAGELKNIDLIFGPVFDLHSLTTSFQDRSLRFLRKLHPC